MAITEGGEDKDANKLLTLEQLRNRREATKFGN